MDLLGRKIWGNGFPTLWKHIIEGSAPGARAEVAGPTGASPPERSRTPLSTQESFCLYSGIEGSRWWMTGLRKWGHKAKIVFAGWTFSTNSSLTAVEALGASFADEGTAKPVRAAAASELVFHVPALTSSRSAWHQGPALCKIQPRAPNQHLWFFCGAGTLSWQPGHASPAWAGCARPHAANTPCTSQQGTEIVSKFR